LPKKREKSSRPVEETSERERGWAPEKTDLGVAAGAVEGKAREPET